MKRILFVSIPIVLALVLAAVAIVALTAVPLAAQSELEDYLRFTHIPSGRVEKMVRAQRPWNLTQDLELPVLGDSWYFQTDQAYGFEPTPRPSHLDPLVPELEYTTATLETGPVYGVSLPYPPQEVWCVLLDGSSQEQVLFVARHHKEPHGTDWVVHQGPAVPHNPQFKRMLSEMGCNLGLNS